LLYQHLKIGKNGSGFRLVSESFILAKNLFHKKTETVLLHSFRFAILFITVN